MLIMANILMTDMYLKNKAYNTDLSKNMLDNKCSIKNKANKSKTKKIKVRRVSARHSGYKHANCKDRETNRRDSGSIKRTPN